MLIASRRLERLSGLDVGKQDRELVAPDPADRIARADRRAQGPHDPPQQFVPRAVPVTVVDLLEMVDVQEQDGTLVCPARRRRDLSDGTLLEAAAVEATRQGSARETSIRAMCWRPWLRACQALIAPVQESITTKSA